MNIGEIIKNNIFFICGWLVGGGTVTLAVICKILVSDIIRQKKEKKQ